MLLFFSCLFFSLDYYDNAAYFHDAVKLSKHKETYVKNKIERHSIKKRAVGCSVKFLEIRLMVDRDMVSYHGQDVMDYTMTIMNIVSKKEYENTL